MGRTPRRVRPIGLLVDQLNVTRSGVRWVGASG